MACSIRRSDVNSHPVRVKHSYWFDAGHRILHNWRAVTGLVMIAAIALSALLAPLVAPHEPFKPNPQERLRSPDARYWMGTDDLGRDILSRLLYGSRVSLLVGTVAVGIASTIGLIVGTVAGYCGGWVDSLLMGVGDVFLSVPNLVLALALVAVSWPSLGVVVVAIGVTGWVSYARVVRGQFLALRGEDFVVAARMVGVRPRQIAVRHILPNAIGPAIVLATFHMASAVLMESGLSFLGLGVQPPLPSWGSILATGRRFLQQAPHIATFPGLAIFGTVLAFNLLGDGLRDALDPRMQRRR